MSDKILPSTGCVDDGCVSNLVCRGCNPAAAVAIVVALGRAVADAVADAVVELVGGGERGGDTTTGGRGWGIEGRVIIVVLINVDNDGSRVKGDRVNDSCQWRRTATRLLLPGGEGGRERSHQGVGNI